MKQEINLEQWNELSLAQKKKLRIWWLDHGYPDTQPDSFPKFDIGRMIEFLGWEDMQFYLIPDNATCRRKYSEDRLNKWTIQDGDYENAGTMFYGDSICDALWEGIKDKIR